MLASSRMAASLNYHDLDNILNQPETEHNWAAKENAIKSLGSACHVDIGQNQEYIQFIKTHRKAFAESLLTERTRLSGAACEMVEKLATSMGRDFGPNFGDLFIAPLLKVCARTNKVMVTRASKALHSTVNAGSLTALPKACAVFATPNKPLRIAVVDIVASCIAQFSSQELEPFLASFEPVLKEGVSDAAPEVRDSSRKSFKIYAQKFPERSSIMTAQLPSNVLKYLLPDTRSTIAPSRTALAGRSAAGRFGEDLPRHQSSRELTTGLSRTGPSRVGPVRARTMALSEQGSSSSSSSSSSSTTFKTPLSPVQSPQAYAHSSSYHQQQQHHHHPQHHQQQPQTHPVRSHGLPSRSASAMDVVESGGGHSSLRLSSQRTRAFSSNTMTTSAMLQRAPSINLATNGGPQRVVPTTPYTTEGSKPARPSSAVNRLSKVEPLSKVGRISSHSGQGAAEKTTMSASERAKAYSQNLKLEMANRNAHGDGSFRTTMSTRRAVTVDHVPSFGVYGHSSSASSVASTTNTSAATSTTSISPISSASASPTALHSPHNDPLFSSFKAPASPQRHERSSTPPEPTYSPEYVRSTPPPSLPSPSHLSFSGHLEDHPMSEEYVEEEGYVQEKLQSHENLEKIDASNVLEQAAREASVESEHQQARTSLPPTPTKPQLEVPQEAAEDFHQEQYSPQGPHSPQGSHSPQVLYSPQGPNSPKQEQSENQQEQEQEQEQQEQEQAFELHAQA